MTDSVARLRTALADRYRFERELGQGGMAIVHLAHDLRHDRKVAVKVLRPEVVAVLGAERFLAEIKTTASLQHPNILGLFDSGASDGLLYYVMPYLEGESLRDRLNRETQLDVETAVAITVEVAGALDYAHRHGVIHRDIKPENILLHDGRPVVADFGIALAVSAAAGGRITETGLSVGTPHYMSPEQAVADRHLTGRTDIFSLGVVLYEMLAGNPPHHGASAQQIVSKIVTEDAAPVSAVRSAVPPNVSDAVGKALERLPADRFVSAKAFADALLDPAFRTVRGGATPGARRSIWPVGVGGVAGGVLIGLALGWGALRPTPASVQTERFVIALPDSAQLSPEAGVNLAWTRDGSRLVYVGPSSSGEAQLWQRRIDRLGVEPIPGTESARIPTVSPNDSMVAFTAQDALKVASLYGGALTTLVPQGVPSVGGGLAWSDDGRIYFVDPAGAIEVIAATGGTPSLVAAPDTTLGGYMWLDALPNRAGLLATIARVGVPDASEIVAVPSSGGPVHKLVRGTMARYVRPGYLLFATAQGTLMAAPFDAKRLEMTGTPVAVGAGVDVYMGSAAQFAVSRDGALAWVSQNVSNELVRMDRRGVGSRIDLGFADDLTYVVQSPDSRSLALTTATSVGLRVWIKDMIGGQTTPLQLSGTTNQALAWSPDGRTLAVVSNQSAPGELWLTRVGEAGATERLPLTGAVYAAGWTPDGAELVAATASPGVASALVTIRPRRDSVARPRVSSRHLILYPTVSPDGRWLAYSTNESGHDEVYVMPYRGNGARWQVSAAGGIEPMWAHSGKELFYRNAAGELTAVALQVDPSGVLHAGPPVSLFPIGASADGRRYAVTADDQHFIVVRPTRRKNSELMVAEHFDVELERTLGR